MTSFQVLIANIGSIAMKIELIALFSRKSEVFNNPETALTNQWTMVSIEFAVNEESRIERATATHRITSAMKRSFKPLSTNLVNNVANAILPRSLVQKVLWDSYSRHSIVFGNVPGSSVSEPDEPSSIGREPHSITYLLLADEELHVSLRKKFDSVVQLLKKFKSFSADYYHKLRYSHMLAASFVILSLTHK